MPERKNRLRKIKLTELSLVDRGANQRAHVVIAKRRAAPLSFEQVQALMKRGA